MVSLDTNGIEIRVSGPALSGVLDLPGFSLLLLVACLGSWVVASLGASVAWFSPLLRSQVSGLMLNIESQSTSCLPKRLGFRIGRISLRLKSIYGLCCRFSQIAIIVSSKVFEQAAQTMPAFLQPRRRKFDFGMLGLIASIFVCYRGSPLAVSFLHAVR